MELLATDPLISEVAEEVEHGMTVVYVMVCVIITGEV